MTLRWAAFPEYDAMIRSGVVSGLTAKAISQSLHDEYGVTVTDDQVSSRIRRLDIRSTLTPEERFERAVVTEQQKAADRALAREMASAVKAKARWDEFLDIIKNEFAKGVVFAQPAVLDFPIGSGTPEIFTLLVGDIHIGKLVDPAVVGNSFGYNYPIFEQRWARLQDRILRLFRLHSNTAPFSAFRIHFLGDGVDGVDMRRGHGNRVDVHSAAQQMLLLARKWEELLRGLATIGIPIDLVWDFGNHGRVGEFGVNLPADNWDYVAGEILAIAISDLYPQVTVRVSTKKYHVTELGRMKVYSSHGDGVRGGDGFSGLPINGLARALAKDTGLHKQIFDLYLTAHFHTPQDIRTQAGRIVMNGSWDGGDDYSVNQLKAASEPVQLAFGVHPTRDAAQAITWIQPIYLTSEQRPATPVEVLRESA